MKVKNKILGFCLTLVLPVHSAFAQAFNPVPVTGFNFDAVCEGFPNATLFTTGTMDLSNYVMFSQAFATSAGISGGLPNSGTITSGANTYQFEPYNVSNALYIPTGNATLTLVTPGKYNAISLAGFSTEGASNIQVALNFTDGTTTTFPTVALSDWFFAAGPIVSGFGRISRVAAAPYNLNGFPSDPRMYACNFTLACADKQKVLESVKVTKISGGNVFIMAVSGNIPPIVTATGGTTCASSPITLTSSVTTTGGTYSWSPGGATTASPVVSPAVTTTYTLSYTLGGCVYTDTANVFVNPSPVVSVNSDTICPGSSTTLNASGALSYTWSPTTDLSSTTGASVTANPPTTTTYTVTGTDSEGCTGTANATVTVYATIPIHVANTTICTDSSTVLTASGADTYTWSPATGLSSTTGTSVVASPGTTTTYTISGIDADGCSGTTTATVTVNPVPDVIPTPSSESICDFETTGIALSSGIAGTTYSWTVSTTNVNGATNGSGTSVAQVLNCFTPPVGTATYTITPTASGCPGNPVDVVITVGSVVIDSITATTLVCFGDNSTVTVFATAATQYSADGGVTFQASNVFSLPAGTYNIIAKKAGGCQDASTITINQPNAVGVFVSPDVTICIGMSTTIFAAGNGGTAPYTYTWDNGLTPDDNHSVSPTVTTTYTVNVTDTNGCGPAIDSVTVTVNPPLGVIALTDQTICENTLAVIGANVTGGNGVYTYTWTNNQNTSILTGSDQTVSPVVTTTYYVTVNDGCGTPPAIDSLVITVLPAPPVSYTIDTTRGCLPLTVNFEHIAIPGSSCAWNFGDGNTDNNCAAQHVFTTAGCHDITLTVISPDGCLNDTTINNQVCVYPLPVAQFNFGPQPTTVYKPEISFVNLSTGGNTYTWDFDNIGSSNFMHPVFDFPDSNSGTYRVCLTAISTQGCIDTTCHNIVIGEEFSVYVPNAFTPNGDHFNDIFLPIVKGEDVQLYELFVFDRWGQIVFRVNNSYTGWDGTRNGVRCKDDVYVWKIKTRDFNGIDHEYTGSITLLR